MDRISLLEPCNLTTSLNQNLTKIASTHKFLFHRQRKIYYEMKDNFCVDAVFLACSF